MLWKWAILKKVQGPFRYESKSSKRGAPEVSIRQRAEDVGFQKACINVDHIAEDRLVGMPFVPGDPQRYCRQRLGGLCDYCKEMSRAAGVEKSNESQKATAHWRMKAARDGEEDLYDPERNDNILGRNKMRLEQWEENFKDPIMALDKDLKCVENQCKSVLLARDLLWSWSSIVCGRQGSGMVPEMWKKPLWEIV